MKITTIPAQKLFRGHSEGQEAFWGWFWDFFGTYPKSQFLLYFLLIFGSQSSKVVQVSSGSLLKTQKSEEGIANRAKMILLNIQESVFFFWSLGGSKIFETGGLEKRVSCKSLEKKFSIFASRMTLLVEKLARMNLGRGFRWVWIISGHGFFRPFSCLLDFPRPVSCTRPAANRKVPKRARIWRKRQFSNENPPILCFVICQCMSFRLSSISFVISFVCHLFRLSSLSFVISFVCHLFRLPSLSFVLPFLTSFCFRVCVIFIFFCHGCRGWCSGQGRILYLHTLRRRIWPCC